jgi:hypothetical protein
MNHLFRSFILLFVFSALLSSCDKEKEGIPSYLHVTRFTFTTIPLSQGLNTSDISSAKVFVNGMEIGNFELPATFPVLAEGNAKVEIFPNIKENGLSNSQKYYKPYEAYSTQTVLELGKLDTIKPHTTYRSNATIKLVEEFEDPGIAFERSGANNTNDSLIRISTSSTGVDQPFGGSSYCGFVKLTSDSFVTFQRNSTGSFTLPNLGTDNYVELDIKSNINIQVGILVYDDGYWVTVPVMVAFPTNNQWKKIYVNLKTETSDLPAGTPIRLFFGFYKDDGDTEDKFVYIDNIKLVYVE